MKFSIGAEVLKMAELLDKSPALRHIVWGMIVVVPITAAIWKLADILYAMQ